MRAPVYHRLPAILAAVCCLLGPVAPAVDADEEPRAAVEDERFFEERVRPLLAEHCQGCHGAVKQSGGLRLDSREAVLKGGDSVLAVVPGKIDESELLAVISHTGAIKMPPKGKLPESDLAVLTEWVRRGAPWGQAPSGRPGQSSAQWQNSHWAFRPVVKPPLPAVVPADSGGDSAVDRFIREKQQRLGLAMFPPADRRTLYRRASFDLLGLPPDADRVRTFEADARSTAAAFASVVDEMLQSPRYGERWGRYWLDLARYADNKGYVFFEEQTYPWGYTYRDWVIRSLNEDLPFDEFIVAQLAADQLPPAQRDRHLAALGFITIGGHFVNNVHDIFDDRIDVVTRGLLGLTVTCARCHDHKFDPISQADYYALYGVFRSSQEPSVLPRLPGPVPEREEFEQFEQELAVRRERLAAFLRGKHAELTASGRSRFAEYLLTAHASRDQPSTEDFMLLIPEGDLHPTVVQRYWLHLQKTRRGADGVWQIWHRLAAIPDPEFATRARAELAELRAKQDGSSAPNPLLLAALEAEPGLQTLKEAATRFGELLQQIDRQWQERLAAPRSNGEPAPAGLPDPHQEELRLVFHAPDAPANMPLTTGWGVLTLLPDRGSQGQYQTLLKQLEEWMIRAPNAPARAMVLEDNATPYDPRIFLRGNPNRPGAGVPRRFLEVLPSESPVFRQGSGRLELARAIAERENPLTARVFVNRVWKHHFGAGLVETPSDFGIRSAPPSHSELLDWLAADFMEQGWSVKRLHRTMMNSAVYRQASAVSPATAGVDQAGIDPAGIDSENRLLWRMNRRRLDFESLRDSLLWSAGTLDLTMGGPSVNLLSGSNRRAVYGFVDRLALPGLLRTFDFPSPDNSSPGRDQTTVAPQALYLMNGPLAQECARQLAGRPEVASRSELVPRVELLFQLLFARLPTDAELEFAREFFAGDPQGQPSPAAWQTYAQALLLTNEFLFID